MPRPPSREEVRYVTAHAAAMALERAANSGTPLDTVVHDWFPDHDAIDRRKIAQEVSEGLEDTRRLVLQRLDRLTANGEARSPK